MEKYCNDLELRVLSYKKLLDKRNISTASTRDILENMGKSLPKELKDKYNEEYMSLFQEKRNKFL